MIARSLSLSRCLVLILLVDLGFCIASEPVRKEYIVSGVAREALVCAPDTAATKACPVIFGFHGHGGNMNNSMRSYGYHRLWPEAIVVYPQGLKTPGRLTDPQGLKAGWQHEQGAEGDRDLKFFDTMLTDLHARFKVDDKRIYSTGHSNGGGFTYLLWAERGETFAAFAPSAAVAPTLMGKLKPKPVLHVAGRNDPLVKFAWQELTMQTLRELNQCGEGKPWEHHPLAMIYTSKIGSPVVTLIHPGTHNFLPQAPEAIVKFFKANAKP